MKELDKLVENYFTEKKAPELGMDMLLEMVEQSLEVMSESVDEEIEDDDFRRDGVLVHLLRWNDLLSGINSSS